jgi:hypothetical protein
LSWAKSLPHRTLGFYALLADDTVPNYGSNANWQPMLPQYMSKGSNVLFFSFINPTDMKVPPAYTNLAKTRGKNENGSIPVNTIIMFSVGGESYSNHPNPWPFLASESAATAMAKQVAQWPSLYGCDGIDIDIETGAGDASNVGPNMDTFVQVLKQTNPGMIVTQPVFGYPQVAAENYIVNHSWDVNSKKLGLVDAVGIMVYQGTQSLQYVKNYAEGSKQWQGFPITVDVTTTDILCGIEGSASGNDLASLAGSIKSQNLGGMIVWFASVIDSKTQQKAFSYGFDDATNVASSMWANAISTMG